MLNADHTWGVGHAILRFFNMKTRMPARLTLFVFIVLRKLQSLDPLGKRTVETLRS